MELRVEHHRDEGRIGDVHAEAFRRSESPDEVPAEVGLVEELRVSEAWIPPLSLVAVIDGEVVGHVVCTRAHVGSEHALALGPIGVRASQQHSGIGTALMDGVIAAADRLGEPLIGLLGSPSYYCRFGFIASSEVGIDPPLPEWGENFQVRTLAAYDPALKGSFRYAEPFNRI